MIENIVVLLLANTLIPMLPVPPEIFAPLPLLHFVHHQTSVYQYMNLSRVHTADQFKKSFRDSLKVLHPDRGGSQQAFSRVKNLKKIMEKQPKAYDCLNVTDIDLEYGMKLQEAIKIKQTTYYVESGIFYFVILLYGLAFTIQDELRPARKYILVCIIILGGYEAYIHFYPQNLTVLDLISDKLPIFQQKVIIKHLLAILIAIIRTKFTRKATPQKQLLAKLEQNQDQIQYKNILTDLLEIYKEKVQRKIANQNSWTAKLRKFISTAFTILIIYSIFSGFLGGGEAEQGRGL